MKALLRTMAPLAALAFSACGGGGGGDSVTPPPSGNDNSAPTISSLTSSLEVLQDSSSGSMTFGIADDRSSASSLTVSAQSSNTQLLPDAGITIGGSGPQRTLLLSPEAGSSGTADVTVSVTDAEGLATTQKLRLTVTAQDASFRNFASDAMQADPEAEPAEVAGHHWMDTAEDDPAAFDTLLTSVAE